MELASRRKYTVISENSSFPTNSKCLCFGGLAYLCNSSCRKQEKLLIFFFFRKKHAKVFCAQRVGKIMIDAGVATWNGKERTWHGKEKKLLCDYCCRRSLRRVSLAAPVNFFFTFPKVYGQIYINPNKFFLLQSKNRCALSHHQN